MACRTSNTSSRRRGFSIAEAMMASMVLAIAVVGVCGPLSAASEQSQVMRERSTALLLARQLMEEIAAKPLLDGGLACRLGPESGESSRGKYDSADDYNGYTDSTSAFKTLDGQTVQFGAVGTFTRQVAVEYRATPSGSASAAGDFGLVTVTVTTPHKQDIKVSRLLTKQSVGL